MEMTNKGNTTEKETPQKNKKNPQANINGVFIFFPLENQ
jgi:hypothetical protein